MQALEKDIIKEINARRVNHGGELLQVKGELSQNAKTLSQSLAKLGVLRHSTHRKYGENVAMTPKQNPSGEDLVNIWYNEIKKYDFDKPGAQPGTSQFTQLVWRGSTHIGVGASKGLKGVFAVANFSPMGNLVNPGYFEENVIPLDQQPKSQQSLINENNLKAQSSSSSFEKKISLSKLPARCSKTKDREENDPNRRESVETKVKFFVDPQGRKVKETRRLITTMTSKNGRDVTTKRTEVTTEFINKSEMRIQQAK